MAKRRKFTADERQYWGQAFVAIDQVSFAAFGAALFLPNLADIDC